MERAEEFAACRFERCFFECGAALASEKFRETEIENLHDAGRLEHDVRRLDIAMHDAFFVRRRDARGDLSRDRDPLAGIDRSSSQSLRERFALAILHNDVRA